VSLEENKAIVRKVVEAANKRNVDLMNEIVAPDFVDHKRQLQGLEVLKQWATMIFKSFSDFHETIEDIIAEGDKVWARFKITATSPTGKKIELSTVTIYHIVNGKIVESWSVPQTVTKKKKPKLR